MTVGVHHWGARSSYLQPVSQSRVSLPNQASGIRMQAVLKQISLSSVLFPGQPVPGRGWRSDTHEIRPRGRPEIGLGRTNPESSSWRIGDGVAAHPPSERIGDAPSCGFGLWEERLKKCVACVIVLHTCCLFGPQIRSAELARRHPETSPICCGLSSLQCTEA